MLIGVLLIFMLQDSCLATYTPKATMIGKWKALCYANPLYATCSSIGKTYRNNDIWLFKIGRGGGGKILFDGMVHGGEDAASELMYDFCAWILSANDSLSKHLRDYNQFWCVPIVDYDVNTRWNANSTGGQQGVNLNRNFNSGWQSASSNKSDGENYRGCKPLSEREAKALYNLFASCGAKFYVSGHMYAQTIYYESSMSSTIRNTVKARTSQLCIAAGCTVYSWTQAGPYGESFNDAQRNFGINSFCYEVVAHPESTLTAMKNAHYKSFKCFMQAVAEQNEVAPPVKRSGLGGSVPRALDLLFTDETVAGIPNYVLTVPFLILLASLLIIRSKVPKRKKHRR